MSAIEQHRDAMLDYHAALAEQSGAQLALTKANAKVANAKRRMEAARIAAVSEAKRSTPAAIGQ